MPTEAWLQAARGYSSLPEAARADYWSRLGPDQQAALREALAFLETPPPPLAPPTTTPPAPSRRPLAHGEAGCFVRSVEALCGALVAGAVAHLGNQHFFEASGGNPKTRIYAAAALGGLLGLFLPEILDRIGRRSRRAAAWLRLALGIVTASTVMLMIGDSTQASSSKISLAVLITLVFWLVFEAATSGFVRFEPGPFSQAIRSTLTEWSRGILTGVGIGIFAGIARALLGPSDISGSTTVFLLFPAVVMAVGVVTRRLAGRLFRSGPKTKKTRWIENADGLILGFFIGAVTAMPAPPLAWGESTYRSALPWLFVAPMVGLLFGLLVGGVSTLGRFAVGHLVFEGSANRLAEVLRELVGTTAIDPPREEPGPPAAEGRAPESVAASPGGSAAASSGRSSRLASCCLVGCAVPVVALVGLMMLGGKVVKSNKDLENLPDGCPPACAAKSMPDFLLDCVPGSTSKCVNFSGADLTGVDLHLASLFGVSFKRAVLRGANLKAASMGSADFTEADLSHADLRGAQLHHATLIGANLAEADLRFVALHGANLLLADLRGAKLSGATYDSNTEWPNRFDPVAAGAKKEGF